VLIGPPVLHLLPARNRPRILISMRFTESPVLPIWLPIQKPELLLKITSHL
jgi:hypothetical protein